MSDYLPDGVLLQNPPWATSTCIEIKNLEPPNAAIPLSIAARDIQAFQPRPTHTDLNAYTFVNFDTCLADLLRSKLDSIDISQSVELNRQVLLARHDTPKLRLRAAHIAMLT